MIVRTKAGEYRADNSVVLLDSLGVKEEAAGPQIVKGDAELITFVLFRLTAEGLA
jgi:hypothetical protein